MRGRLIGDDNAFDDGGIGAGWAWDYLTDNYAAPSGALSYNENVVTYRIAPGKAEGDPATVTSAPAGRHRSSWSTTRARALRARTPACRSIGMPGSPALVVSGRVPAGGATVSRTTTIDNPTRYFVEALRLALESRGIRVSEGACGHRRREERGAG